MYTEEYDDVWNNKPAEINSDNLLQETLQKESFIKEITQSKENLNDLIEKTRNSDAGIDKLRDENVVLQNYIDNLTRQSLLVANNSK